jgi:hypothetical protein
MISLPPIEKSMRTSLSVDRHLGRPSQGEREQPTKRDQLADSLIDEQKRVLGGLTIPMRSRLPDVPHSAFDL